MNRIFFKVAGALGAIMIAAPAIADEAPANPVKHVRHVERAPVRAAPAQAAPSTQSNWTGSQIGGQGGASSMAQGFAEPGSHLYPYGCAAGQSLSYPYTSSYCMETPFFFNGHNTSATGGAFLGYRAQMGYAVVGVEIDGNYKSGSTTSALTDSNLFRTESFSGTLKQTGDGSLRVRAGVLVTPWVLLYGTAGGVVGEINGSYSYSAYQNLISACSPCGPATVNGSMSWSDARMGWTAGGGVEALIMPGVTLRVEYRHNDFGDYSKYIPLATQNCSSVCSSPTSNAVINLHPTFDTVKAGVGFGF
jgi:outer membrane immunogenic protein